jgi:hypothetical protein
MEVILEFHFSCREYAISLYDFFPTSNVNYFLGKTANLVYSHCYNGFLVVGMLSIYNWQCL